MLFPNPAGVLNSRMADQVFAAAPEGKAFVFRYNFGSKKWESFAKRSDSASVTFRKRDDKVYIRIAYDGHRVKKQHAAHSRRQCTFPVSDSGW